MADEHADIDRDSTFGDDESLLAYSMFSSLQPLAGTKRAADNSNNNARTQSQSAQSIEYPAGSIDARALCCANCPESCPEACNRLPKRCASAAKVGEYHNISGEAHSNIDNECQFPDDCFEKFCQDCNLDVTESCTPDCASPCSGPDCPEDSTCFDPHCAQNSPECTDGCTDPECTKLACPDQPCFCQKCDAQPCPLGDPNNDCHFAHSAPTPVGTIYCYDNAPCHFQQGLHEDNNSLADFETYPCYSQNHGFTMGGHPTTNASTVATPVLSHSNYASMESALASEPSPAPAQGNLFDCFLNISTAHCHIDKSCCHGPQRAHDDYPFIPQQELDLWHKSTAESNSLATDFMNFGFSGSNSMSPLSVEQHPMSSLNPFGISDSLSQFRDQLWIPDNSASPAMFGPSHGNASKLDFLVNAAQSNVLVPDLAPLNTSSIQGAGTSESSSHTCKWQHSPGVLCLAIFESSEALHKHIKTTHVDNCAHCYCQWEGCESSAKDFKQRSKLSRHLLGHAGYRPYACSYEGCDKMFATNQAKDNHERTHTGERPYICDRCGYTTTTHTQLQTHISALHDGKKPHKCRFCEFTCADSSNLSKHERTHQTLRPYRCPQPNCTFKPDCRWENLKRHLRRSGHCPHLLEEASDEYKAYRESVRREIEEWHKRNGDGGLGKTGRRKGRG